MYLGCSDRLSQTVELGNSASVDSLAVNSDLIASLTNELLSLLGKVEQPTCMGVFGL